jgi:hypothetical protein
MLRVVRLRSRAFVAVLAAIALVIAGVLFFWLHDTAGPLAVADLDSTAVVPADHPVVIVIPVNAPATDSVVIDSVSVQSAGGVVPAPEVTGIYADPDTSCDGIWFPLHGAGSFTSSCTTGPLRALSGSPAQGVLLADRASQHGYRGLDLALQVSPPDPPGCWIVASIEVHYHIGDRHYLAKTDESITGCIVNANMDPTQS